MDKQFLLLMFFVLLGCSQNKEKEPQVINVEIVYLEDTVKSGNPVSAKVFLNNQSLYKLARENNINEYLKIQFWDGNTNTGLQSVPINSDTGLISFTPIVDEINSDSITAHVWEVGVFIKFLKNDSEYDTLFRKKTTVKVTNE